MSSPRSERVKVRVLTTSYYGQTMAITVTVADDRDGIRAACNRRFGAGCTNGIRDEDLVLLQAAIDGISGGVANVPIKWHVTVEPQTIHQQAGWNVPAEEYTHVVRGVQRGSVVIGAPVARIIE